MIRLAIYTPHTETCAAVCVHGIYNNMSDARAAVCSMAEEQLDIQK